MAEFKDSRKKFKGCYKEKKFLNLKGHKNQKNLRKEKKIASLKNET